MLRARTTALSKGAAGEPTALFALFAAFTRVMVDMDTVLDSWVAG